MKPFSRLLLPVVFLSISSFCYSQQKPDHRQENPFEENGEEKSPRKIPSPEPGEKNAFIIKTNVSRFLRGELPILTEFRLGRKWSLELGPSFTHRDILANFWVMEFDPFSAHKYPFSAGSGVLGYGLTSTLKFFHKERGNLEGMAWGLYGNIRQNRFNYEGLGIRLTPGNVNVRELGLQFCMQENWGFFVEFDAGIGIRHYQMDIITVTEHVGPWGKVTQSYSSTQVKKLLPVGFISYKFGFDFLE